MPKDGTDKINPNGKTMYLTLSGKRGSGTPRVQIKVSSVREASQQMSDWVKKTGIYRSDISSSHINLGGMTVAKCCFDGKVLRVDPFTKAVFPVDAPDRVLYDPAVYAEQEQKEKDAREQRQQLRATFNAKKHEILALLFNSIKDVALNDARLQRKDDVEQLAKRFSEPYSADNAIDQFTLKFSEKSSDYPSYVKCNFDTYYGLFKITVELSRSGVIDVTAGENVNVLDKIIDIMMICRNIASMMKTTIASETGLRLFEEFRAMQKIINA